MNTTSSSPHFGPTAASDVSRSDRNQPQVDATGRLHATGERALVLGGGGSTGNAWLIGGKYAQTFDSDAPLKIGDPMHLVQEIEPRP